jgi:hypothetical protein
VEIIRGAHIKFTSSKPRKEQAWHERHNMEPICFAISLPSIYYALNLDTLSLVKILDPSNLRSLNFVKDKSRHFDSKYLLF